MVSTDTRQRGHDIGRDIASLASHPRCLSGCILCKSALGSAAESLDVHPPGSQRLGHLDLHMAVSVAARLRQPALPLAQYAAS